MPTISSTTKTAPQTTMSAPVSSEAARRTTTSAPFSSTTSAPVSSGAVRRTTTTAKSTTTTRAKNLTFQKASRFMFILKFVSKNTILDLKTNCNS